MDEMKSAATMKKRIVLVGWKDGSIWSWVQTIRVVECVSLDVDSALAPPRFHSPNVAVRFKQIVL